MFNDNVEVGSLEWNLLTSQRAELIHKKHRGGLDEEETVKLERLQEISRRAIQKKFPAPMMGMAEITLIKSVIGGKSLPHLEMQEALVQGPDKRLVIGVIVDRKTGTLIVTDHNFDKFLIPMSDLTPSGTTKPDFDKVEVTDYGLTVAFGEYEVASDWLLGRVQKENA